MTTKTSTQIDSWIEKWDRLSPYVFGKWAEEPLLVDRWGQLGAELRECRETLNRSPRHIWNSYLHDIEHSHQLHQQINEMEQVLEAIRNPVVSWMPPDLYDDIRIEEIIDECLATCEGKSEWYRQHLISATVTFRSRIKGESND